MRGYFVFIFAGVLLSGCSSFFPKDFQPVTKQRCEALDMKALGFKDGSEGYQRGTKYDFFFRDCEYWKVTLDRKAYEQGYEEGMENYCSCDTAFVAGVKEELIETRLKYFSCSDEQKKRMKWAYDEGEKLKDDTTYLQKTSTSKVNYFDDKILARAKEVCISPTQ